MKDAPRKQKPRDEVSLTFLVYTRGLPTSVALREHSLQFTDDEFKPVAQTPGLINGVFGLFSKQQALVAASKWGRDHENSRSGSDRVLLLDVNYKIENYHLTREQIRPEILEKTGWLHFERLASTYREEIREQWLKWIARDFNDAYVTALRGQEIALTDLARRHPKYVARMMTEDQTIRAVVHPVRPLISPDSIILTATVRDDPKYFAEAHVRFLPLISVVV